MRNTGRSRDTDLAGRIDGEAELRNPGGLFLGLDCGGTRTRCILLRSDDRGQVTALGLGHAGPGNLRDVGRDGLRRAIDAACHEAWGAVSLARGPVRSVFCGVAGVASEDERAVVREVLIEAGLAEDSDIEVDHDLRIALAGALSGEAGIVVIAGTGSACYGRAEDGRTWRSGGFGSFLDDRGGGFDLARGGLIACVRSQDRRGPRTSLEDKIRRHLGLDEWRDLLGWVDAHKGDRAEIARLAPLVTHAALQGDDVARRLIDEGTKELALCVATVAKELACETPSVSATGGLTESGTLWKTSFDDAIHRALPGAHIVPPAHSPVFGAGLLALQRAGAPVDADARATWPRPEPDHPSPVQPLPRDAGSSPSA